MSCVGEPTIKRNAQQRKLLIAHLSHVIGYSAGISSSMRERRRHGRIRIAAPEKAFSSPENQDWPWVLCGCPGTDAPVLPALQTHHPRCSRGGEIRNSVADFRQWKDFRDSVADFAQTVSEARRYRSCHSTGNQTTVFLRIVPHG